MRVYRASKRPPKKTIIINNQPQPQPQPQLVQQPKGLNQVKKTKKTKGTSTINKSTFFSQVVKDYVPMYKSPNAQLISDNSIATYLSQFKKVCEHFTKKKLVKLKNELIKYYN
jgi:hypothetical protein